MNRLKNFPKLIASGVAFIICFYSCRKSESLQAVSAKQSQIKASNTEPNIVFILLDDVGFEVPTCYGGQSYETPHIDELAREGMLFTQCFGSPLCSPSRFMLLTGKYNFRNYTEWGVMNPNEKTIATLLRDAGYNTYVAGKWQLDGGDASIHSLGFNDYCVWLPFNGVAAGAHYKNPQIYENGANLSDAQTRGKFGDDIFTNRILRFIDSNATKKFFIYDAITLSHSPFVPTPDDPEFLTWNFNDGSDTSFFPSMIKYMDKKVGQIINHLKDLGLYDNTLIVLAGDNGTSQYIESYNKGKLMKGGKGETNIFGTRLPFIVSYPNHVSPGQTNANLVDFTDLLPTLADAAGIAIPKDYGTIDGKSFYPQLLGDFSKPRTWVFNHFQPSHDDEKALNSSLLQTKVVRWANTNQYKLYDSTHYFYNISKDPYERKPLTNLTSRQKQIKDNLQAVIDRMHN